MILIISVLISPSYAASAANSASSSASHSVTTEKIFNMRDLGGYETRSGRSIKPGLIYRSGELAYATESDLAILEQRGIAQIIDFRYPSDVKFAPDVVPSGTTDTLVQVRKEGSQAASRAKSRYDKFSKTDTKTFHARFAGSQNQVEESYTQGLVFDTMAQNAYKKYFEMLLANTEGKPLLFHCVAGKDRTGVAAVMTLLVLGVDEETAINEYASTNDFYKSIGSSKYGASQGVNPDHMRSALSKIKKDYGSYNAFFEKVYGLAAEKREQLRDIYLTPADEPRRTCIRIDGETRYDTAINIADVLKTDTDAQFRTIVLASGDNYPDALSGNSLAIRNDAPLLLINSKNSAKITDYIRKNLIKSDGIDDAGKIFILGGSSVISDSVVSQLESDEYDVIRLSGINRYETNLAILSETCQDGDEIFICTGESYADSLSASATGLPIMLINPETGITREQKDFLSSHNITQFCVAGGELAVSSEAEHDLMQLGNVTRLSGKNRYETSAAIANYFSADSVKENVVIAYGQNFPDGLCAGPLAYRNGAMILLATNEKITSARSYCISNHIQNGVVIGGASHILDETAEAIIRCDEVM